MSEQPETLAITGTGTRRCAGTTLNVTWNRAGKAHRTASAVGSMVLAALLLGCSASWQLDFVNDSGAPLMVTVQTGDASASWVAAPGQGLTLMRSASRERGRAMLMTVDSCRVLDEIELPVHSATLFVDTDLESGEPQLIVADDAPPTSDPDPPRADGCPSLVGGS